MKDKFKQCRYCKFFEPYGIMYSSLPECMYYQELADNALRWCHKSNPDEKKEIRDE